MDEKDKILQDLFYKTLARRANPGEIQVLKRWLEKEWELAMQEHARQIAEMKGESCE